MEINPLVKGLKEEKNFFKKLNMNKIIIYSKSNTSEKNSKNIKLVEIIQYVISLGQRIIPM